MAHFKQYLKISAQIICMRLYSAWYHFSISIKLSQVITRQKGGDLTQSYDKSPYTNRNIKRAKWQHKQRHKKFDQTAIADRLRTVSWSNYSQPIVVVNLVYGPRLRANANIVLEMIFGMKTLYIAQNLRKI